MSHAQQMKGLGLNLVECKDFALQRLVVTAETAVDTIVHTSVAGVDWSKQHKATAIDLVLAILGGVENLLYVGFVLHTKQFGHVLEVEAFELAGFIEDVVELRLCRCVVVEHSVQFVAVDEILVSHVI